jgi:hypothetical protein
MSKCLRCGATNEWIEPMGRRSAKAKAPVLDARDWAAIWRDYHDWLFKGGLMRGLPACRRKLQALVNARPREKARGE